jgi:GT2 family glycosyltransferase
VRSFTDLLAQARRLTRGRRGREAWLARRLAAANLAFPEHERPRVSVLIAMHGRPDVTLDALVALGPIAREAAIEVLLCDDRSPDDSGRFFAGIPGLRLVRNAVNLSYLRSNNALAHMARGEFLLLLNNDTVIQPRALTALLDVFESRADAGIAGARLLYPDGRLQEAGAEVLVDGHTVRRGWRERENTALHDRLEEVDYCSAACILVPRELFLAVGGFDELYLPGYYEDVDLAFKVRAAGRRVYFQPAARVVHLTPTREKSCYPRDAP